jgi:hypothetical protein
MYRFCSRLLEYPGPEKEEAKAILRELRSRATMPSTTTLTQPSSTTTAGLLRTNTAISRSRLAGGRDGGGGGTSSGGNVPDVFEFSP